MYRNLKKLKNVQYSICYILGNIVFSFSFATIKKWEGGGQITGTNFWSILFKISKNSNDSNKRQELQKIDLF